MNKRVILVLFLALASVFFVVGVKALSSNDIETAMGTGTKVVNSNQVIKFDDNGTLPLEYGFALGLNKGATVDYSGVTALTATEKATWNLHLDDQNAPMWGSIMDGSLGTVSKAKTGYTALYKNAGNYKGQSIDVKATIMNFEANTDGAQSCVDSHPNARYFYDCNAAFNYQVHTPWILWRNDKMGVFVGNVKWVTVKLEFFKAGTSTAIDIKGNTSYWDVDVSQGIIMEGNTNQNIYARNNSRLYIGSISGNKFVYDKATPNNEASGTEIGITETFEGTSITRSFNFYAYYFNEGINSSNGTISFTGKPVVYTIPAAPTKSVSQNDITELVKNNQTFKYTISQVIPNSYYESFVFSDTLEPVLTATGLTIKDENNIDRTSWFTTSLGQTVTATLKSSEIENPDFYGHTYKFIIDAKVKSGLKDADVASYRDGTVYKIPDKASVTIDGTKRETNTVYVYYYRGMCPGGNCSDKTDPEPTFPPKKTVSTNYTNEITTFDYRVSQVVPGFNSAYLWTGLTITDTIDKAFDMDKTTVKVINSLGVDVSSGNDKKFNIQISDRTITASAVQSALTQSSFYGTTYTLVITTKVKEGFDFAGYQKNGDNYIIINNKASRKFLDKDGREYGATTPNVPTLQVNPKIPSKAVDTEMVRPGFEYHYTITQDVQPATADNYYDSYVFKDVLEPPLQISGVNKVKITQISANGTKKDYTNNFDININGNEVTASLKQDALKNADFYGTRGTDDTEVLKKYQYELTVSLRDDVDESVDMSKYYDEVQAIYVIPNKANITSKTPGNSPISNDTNNVNVYYYPESAPLKSTVADDITSLYANNESFVFDIVKSVVEYDENLYYKSFVFEDTLEDCLEPASSLVVKNEDGNDVTNLFNVSIANQKVSASLKNPNNAVFYGHTYTFSITTKVKQKYNLDKWKKDNKYVIPNEAKVVIDDKIVQKTNKKEVYIVPQVVEAPKTDANIPLYVVIAGLLLVGTGISVYFITKNKKNNLLKK